MQHFLIMKDLARNLKPLKRAIKLMVFKIEKKKKLKTMYVQFKVTWMYYKIS